MGGWIGIFAMPGVACAGTTLIYQDDFESGVSGWSLNPSAFDDDLTNFLGRFDNSPTTVSRTFTLPTGTASARVSFDFYKIDSWDNTAQWGFDRWEVEVGGSQIFSLPFSSDQPARSGSTAGVDWSITPLGPPAQLAFGSGQSWTTDQLHRVVLDIDAPGTALELTLRTAINQGGNDESGGYDNFEVLAFGPPPQLTGSKTVEVVGGGFAVPGAEVDYRIDITNAGGAADAGTLVVTDILPPEVELFTGDLDGSGSAVAFTDASAPASGYVCCATGEVEFSATVSGAPVWGYVPATPYDPDVTRLRITPSGTPRDAVGNPVSLGFRIRARIP